MSLREYLDLILVLLGIAGGCFAVLNWMREDMLRQFSRETHRLDSQFDEISEELKTVSGKLSDLICLSASTQKELEGIEEALDALGIKPKPIRHQDRIRREADSREGEVR